MWVRGAGVMKALRCLSTPSERTIAREWGLDRLQRPIQRLRRTGGLHDAHSDTSGSQQRLLLCGSGALDEHVRLLQCLANATAGYVEILGLYLDADELATELDGGNASRARAHKWVNDYFAFGRKPEQKPLRKGKRFWACVAFAFGFIYLCRPTREMDSV